MISPLNDLIKFTKATIKRGKFQMKQLCETDAIWQMDWRKCSDDFEAPP